jgi:hypothetical protein
MDERGRRKMAHISLSLARAVDEELLDYEQVKSRPKWRALTETACAMLNNLYQAIGAEYDHAPET